MRRRTFATVVFGLMALAEIGDVVGLAITLANPAQVAAQHGISVRAETVRAIILLVLGLVIALNALIATAGLLMRQSLLFAMGALSCAGVLIVYGAYQLVSALAQLHSPLLAIVGLAYIGLGALAFWLGRRTVLTRT